MAVTDLTSLISPGMKLTTTSSARTVQPAGSADAAYTRAERELQESVQEMERQQAEYNQLVESYNTASSAGAQALLDPLIEEQAERFNASIRRYNELGNQYQASGIISGFSVVEEFKPEKLKPKLSAAPEGVIQGKSDVIIQESKPLGMLGALNLVRGAFITEGVRKSQDIFHDAGAAVKGAVDVIQRPVDADQLADEQYRYQDRLGKTQIVLGESIGTVLPRFGQLLKDSGSEILVSRDYNRKGLIDFETGTINRPSIYELAGFGSALGAAGAAVGSGLVTGVSGFGSLFPKVSAVAFEKSVLDSAVTGGASGGAGLANVGANVGKTFLLGLSSMSSQLQEIDSGIGDILNQYPRRNQYEERAPPVSGEVDIGIGDILGQYPTRNRYGDRYSRNDATRNQNWNRSELDYRDALSSGYSTRLVEDSVFRNRYDETNQNRYRNETDYFYEYAALTEVAPQNRRRSRYDDEEESFIAEPRRKGKKKRRTFTERLIL